MVEKVQARFAKPGVRYITQRGVVIEAAANRKGVDGGEIELWHNKAKGEVFFWTYRGGKRTEVYVKVPEAYELTVYTPDSPEIVRRSNRGRPHNGASDWHGWAYHEPRYCESLLSEAEELGCIVDSTVRYFKICLRTQQVASVWRSGVVGFDREPDFHRDHKYHYALKPPCDGERFMLYRYDLRLIQVKGDYDSFLAAFKEYLVDSMTMPPKRKSRRVATKSPL